MKNDKVPIGLQRLSALKSLEVADKSADITSWDVFSGDNKHIGKVDDLIVDTSSMKVKYIDVLVNEDVTGVNDDKHILVPVSSIFIEDKKDRVHISSIETKTLLHIPKFEGFTDENEDEVRRSLNYSPASSSFRDNSNRDNLDRDNSNRDNSNRDNSNFNRQQQPITADPEPFSSVSSFKSEVSTARNVNSRLTPLKNYGGSFDFPDVRGWNIYDKNEEKIGDVDEIIVDSQTGIIRYLDIKLDTGLFSKAKHILLPVGTVYLNEEDRKILTDLPYSAYENFPDYSGGGISRTYETDLRNKIRNAFASNDQQDDFYDNLDFNQDRFYKGRHKGIRW